MYLLFTDGLSGDCRTTTVPVPGRFLSDVGHRNLLLCPRDAGQNLLHHGQQVHVKVQKDFVSHHCLR